MVHSSLITQAAFSPRTNDRPTKKEKICCCFYLLPAWNQALSRRLRRSGSPGLAYFPKPSQMFHGQPAAQRPHVPLRLSHWRPHTHHLKWTEDNSQKREQWTLGGAEVGGKGKPHPQTSPSSLQTPASTFLQHARRAPALGSWVKLVP